MHHDKVTILLADDDLDDQQFLKEAMAFVDPNVCVKLFGNGREIIDYLVAVDVIPPRLIVLDYNMPLATGLQVLQKIANDSRLKHVPIVVWSSSPSHAYMNECLSYGIKKYFVKPDDLVAYRQIAAEMLGFCFGPA